MLLFRFFLWHFTFNFSSARAAFCAIHYFCLSFEGNILLCRCLGTVHRLSDLISDLLLFTISFHCTIPSPEKKIRKKMHSVTFSVIKQLWRADSSLLSWSSFLLPAMTYGKKPQTPSVWMMQKVKSEKETGGNWYACYYKTGTNMRQTKWLKQADIRCPEPCPESWHETLYYINNLKNINPTLPKQSGNGMQEKCPFIMSRRWTLFWWTPGRKLRVWRSSRE